MGRITKVTCDGCGYDLTVRTGSVDYRLVLCSESKPGYGNGPYTEVLISPPVDREYYFCGLECLDYWRSRKHHEANNWRIWWGNWKEKNATDYRSDGRVLSYISPPLALTNSLSAEFEAAALKEFPYKFAPRDQANATGAERTGN